MHANHVLFSRKKRSNRCRFCRKVTKTWRKSWIFTEKKAAVNIQWHWEIDDYILRKKKIMTAPLEYLMKATVLDDGVEHIANLQIVKEKFRRKMRGNGVYICITLPQAGTRYSQKKSCWVWMKNKRFERWQFCFGSFCRYPWWYNDEIRRLKR